MRNLTRRSESGQAFILLVLAFVGLLGFAALALDGGMVYSDRRIAQNAADAAALAGAAAAGQDLKSTVSENWKCAEAKFVTAQNNAKASAVASADVNGFTITPDSSVAHNTVSTECHNGGALDKYLEVRVRITKQTNTSFAHFVFSGAMVNTVDAVARVDPRKPFAQGNALVSLTYNCGSHFDRGTIFSGDEITKIKGGGMHSNSCLTLNGHSGYVEVDTSTLMDEYKNNGEKALEPATPVITTVPIVLQPLETKCSTLGAPTGNDATHMNPGVYKTPVKINNSENVTMESGLYCFEKGLQINGGGTLQSEVGSTPTDGGVTLVMLGGDFESMGNALVVLKAPPGDCDTSPDTAGLTCPKAIPGMLIYMPPENEGKVQLAGTADSSYRGTIFAPKGYVDVGGSSDVSDFKGQVIADSIEVHGNTQINLTYDEKDNYTDPARLSLQR